MQTARAAHVFQPYLDRRDPLADAAPIDLQHFFAGAARADAGALPRQVRPHAAQPGHQVLQLRQFDLQLAFGRSRALGEDVEDQAGAVHDHRFPLVFEIALLHRREIDVEHHAAHLVLRAFDDFLQPRDRARADERGGRKFRGALLCRRRCRAGEPAHRATPAPRRATRGRCGSPAARRTNRSGRQTAASVSPSQPAMKLTLIVLSMWMSAMACL